MKIEYFKCDKCGKHIEPVEYTVHVKQVTPEHHVKVDKVYDLCEECFEQIKEVL